MADPESGSSKAQKAKKLGTKCLDEAGFDAVVAAALQETGGCTHSPSLAHLISCTRVTSSGVRRAMNRLVLVLPWLVLVGCGAAKSACSESSCFGCCDAQGVCQAGRQGRLRLHLRRRSPVGHYRASVAGRRGKHSVEVHQVLACPAEASPPLNFLSNCKGVITNTSRPRTGRFMRYESFRSSRRLSRDVGAEADAASTSVTDDRPVGTRRSAHHDADQQGRPHTSCL